MVVWKTSTTRFEVGPLWGVAPEACAPFIWGMDLLLSVLLMRLWTPFQRQSTFVIMSITPHKNPIRRDCLNRGG